MTLLHDKSTPETRASHCDRLAQQIPPILAHQGWRVRHLLVPVCALLYVERLSVSVLATNLDDRDNHRDGCFANLLSACRGCCNDVGWVFNSCAWFPISAPGGGERPRAEEDCIPNPANKDASTSCAFFLKTGTCAYGDKCKFSHPLDKVPIIHFNTLGLPLRPGEPDCAFYMKTLRCGFGASCKFNHPEAYWNMMPLVAPGQHFMQTPPMWPPMMPHTFAGTPSMRTWDMAVT